MDQDDRSARRAEEKLRREAAGWFARMRGPDADRYRARFDAWRAANPLRQAIYDRLIQRWDDAGVLTHSQLSAPCAGAARAKKTLSLTTQMTLGFAGLATCFALAVIMISPAPRAWLDGGWLSAFGSQPLQTKIGEIRTIRLADGSSVILDTDTLVTARFARTERRLELLRGRARFDVAHDPSRPFVVMAGGGEVAAKGTLFDVSLSPDQSVAVTLIRGVVEVDPGPLARARGTSGRTSARLQPGQHLAFGRNMAAPRIEPASASAALWPQGLLTFHDTPLSQALAEANRYSPGHIVLEDEALADLRVSGVFKAMAPHEFASSLAAAFDLQVADAPNGDRILKRAQPPAPSNSRAL